MKISDLVRFVNEVKPNQFAASTVVMWLNEVEGMVWTDIMLLSPLEFKAYSYDETTGEGDCDLMVKAPHSKLYAEYLTAMIDYYNGEYDKYQNTMAMFNNSFGEYSRWYAMNYRPADGEFGYKGIYISAYGLAVKHGFVGTEEEWLASLKGNTGDSAYDEAKKQGYTGTQEQFGEDQAKFAENAASVRQNKESTEESARAAQSSEESAAESARSAAESAGDAAKNASVSLDFATVSKEAAGYAERILQRVQSEAAGQISSLQDEGEMQRRTLLDLVSEQQNKAERAAEDAEESARLAKESEENAAQRIAEETERQISEIKEAGEEELAKFSSEATAVLDQAAGWTKKSEEEAIRAEEAAEKAETSVANGAYISVTVEEDGYLYLEKTENANDIDLSLDEDGYLFMEVNE